MYFIDFQTLSDDVSKKILHGAKVSLEQVVSTDSILVSNLSTQTEDVLELYFGSSRSGGADVVAVSLLSDGCAKVSFKDVKCKLNVVVFLLALEVILFLNLI